MADLISIITGAIGIANQLRDAAKKIKDVEVKHLTADLSLALADIKLEVAELKEQNLQLQQELRTARERADFRGKLELRDGVYFFKEPVENYEDGPYCPNCFDVNATLVTVHRRMRGRIRQAHGYDCHHCKGKFD